MVQARSNGGRRPSALLVAAAVVGSLFAAASSSPAGGQSPPPAGVGSATQAPTGAPARSDGSVDLADSTLRAAVSDIDNGDPTNGVAVDGGDVHVEVLHHTTDAAARALIEARGGTVTGSVPGVLVEGDVPADALEGLEAEAAVDVVRPPLAVNAPVALPGAGGSSGEEVAETRADLWQLAGQVGAGVRVGIIDGFSTAAWNAALATEDVPAAAGTFCQSGGAVCNVFNGGTAHGVAVAEIVHEMAPSAQIYLGSATTTADTQAVVDYFVSQGVDIITRSLTSRFDGPGNGTGPMATVIDNAVANGIAWFQSAGNSAGSAVAPTRLGSYYRFTYADADADGWLEFAPGDELLGMNCGFQNGLRWDDFGSANATDYDLYLFDAAGSAINFQSENDQGSDSPGSPPIEFTAGCSGVNQVGVRLFEANDGAAGAVLEFGINGTGMERWVNPGSASGPAADQNSAGALTVGAIDPATGNTIGNYSSQGPTNDGRIKPDLSAPSCVASQSLDPCFNGTSAATPVAAGAAALLLGSGLATTPQQVRTWLLANAVSDRGAVGPDNIYGAGELFLPPVIQGGAGTVVEGNAGGTTNLQIPVNLSGPSSATVAVNWSTLNTGQPAPGVDYVAASGSLTFVPGDTQEFINITVIGDTLDEPGQLFGAEWLFVGLSSPSKAVFGNSLFAAVAHGLIADNDPPPVLQGGAGVVTEGASGTTTTLQIPVNLSAPSGGTVTVNWSTANTGQPAPGVDYVAASGTLTFVPGDTQEFISVTVNGDSLDEPGQLFGAEWLFVGLSSPTNAVFGSDFFATVAHGFIVDDD